MSPINSRRQISLILSYVVDWVIVVVVAIASSILGNITPNKRPFSLTDLSISYPHTDETISFLVLILCSLVAPAILIFVLCLLFAAPHLPKSAQSSVVWRRRLWDWHASWLGLALSLASAWLLVSCSKNLFGKPRPDLLARCQPDLNNITQYAIGQTPNVTARPGETFLVSADICQNTDTSVLEDGWRSFPSGHASFAAAGLVYLSLFLASRLGVGIPWLLSSAKDDERAHSGPGGASRTRPAGEQTESSDSKDDNSNRHFLPVHGRVHPHGHNTIAVEPAAAPIYLIFVCSIPTLVAIYIASTRYSDFRHAGFDILFGFLIGTVTAWFAFRCYHGSLARHGGVVWGSRGGGWQSWWVGRAGTAWTGADATANMSRAEDGKRSAEREDYEMSSIVMGGERIGEV